MIRRAAPEFNGFPFEHTWIWGVQGGEISFWEPMITIQFLQTVRANFGQTGWYNASVYGGREVSTPSGDGIAVPIPGLNTAAGYPITQAEEGQYPSEYCILWSEETLTFTVAMINFDGLCQTSEPSDLTCPDFVSGGSGGSPKGGNSNSGRRAN